MTDKEDRPASRNANRDARYSLSEHIDHNIESMVEVQRKERNATGPSQRLVEKLSLLIARPGYLFGLVLFVMGWIVANLLRPYGITPFDPVPFGMLDALLTFFALVTTTIVLIAQNRQAKLEQQHRHLDLQVGLLTEQKRTRRPSYPPLKRWGSPAMRHRRSR
jgi:uncharacterized membrane protein